MRTACFSAMAADLPLEKLLRLLTELGCAGLEAAAGYPHSVWDDGQWHLNLAALDREASRLKMLMKDTGLSMIGIASPPLNEDTQKRIIDFSAEIGCSFVRIGCLPYNPEEGYTVLRERMRATLLRLVEYSAGYTLKLVVETHPGNITPSASLARKLVDGFDCRRVGVIWDPGNQILEGYEDPALAIDLLGPYLGHVHVKNLAWHKEDGTWTTEYTALADGQADWNRILSLLDRAGYNGWCSIEDFRGGYCRTPVGITTEQKLKQDMTFLREHPCST